MGAPCRCCKHPKKHEINDKLSLGHSFNEISRDYNMSSGAVANHFKNHLSPIIDKVREEARIRETAHMRVTTVSKAVSGLDKILENWDVLEHKLITIMNDPKTPKSLIPALREWRALQSDKITAMAKIAELKNDKISLSQLPEWGELKELLNDIIGDCPRCKPMLWNVINGGIDAQPAAS